jgi:hypothetical protein
VAREIKLVDDVTEQVDINPPAWGDEAGSDFDDDAHGVSN